MARTSHERRSSPKNVSAKIALKSLAGPADHIPEPVVIAYPRFSGQQVGVPTSLHTHRRQCRQTPAGTLACAHNKPTGSC